MSTVQKQILCETLGLTKVKSVSGVKTGGSQVVFLTAIVTRVDLFLYCKSYKFKRRTLLFNYCNSSDKVISDSDDMEVS